MDSADINHRPMGRRFSNSAAHPLQSETHTLVVAGGGRNGSATGDAKPQINRILASCSSHRIFLASAFGYFLLFLLLLASSHSSCQALELNISQANLAEDNLEKLIDSIEPRQYFKVNAAATPATETNAAAGAAGEPSGSQLARRTSKGIGGMRNGAGKDSPSPVDKAQRQVESRERAAGSKHKAAISNATLKKLLGQSLLKPATGSGGSKGSNFKFVFIQRATAAPKTLAGESTDRKPDSQPEGKQSLASSVSKQLASSLLYNAVSNLVSNMTSSAAPSLTSLASQIVGAPSSSSASGAPPTSGSSDGVLAGSTTPLARKTPETSSTPVPMIAKESEESNDIKRVQAQPAIGKSSESSPKRKSGAKRKQSKIYNLPVKFVSNGQPNLVVFNAIKQHFATIKKLQLATSKLHQHYHSPGSTISKLTKHHSRRPSSSKSSNPSGKPFKQVGANSRLIYLPLNFLSNARPSKILIGGVGGAKATHKSIRATES